jgi:hypothetical protein
VDEREIYRDPYRRRLLHCLIPSVPRSEEELLRAPRTV